MTPYPLEFLKQTDRPLYPKVLYNRPVTRHGAGRMLIVGGHAGEFSLPTSIYSFAMASGIGEVTAVLPDNLAKLLGGAPGTVFASSNASGSLDQTALGRIIELSEDMDAIAIGASLSNNSSTSMLVERLITELDRPLILFEEALPAMRQSVNAITGRAQTLIILTLPEVFKLCGALGIPIQIRKDGGLLNKLEIVQNLAIESQCTYAVYGPEIIVADSTSLTVTPIPYQLSLTPALFHGVLSTFWIQNTQNALAGLTTGAYLISRVGEGLEKNERPSTKQLIEALNAALKATEDF